MSSAIYVTMQNCLSELASLLNALVGNIMSLLIRPYSNTTRMIESLRFIGSDLIIFLSIELLTAVVYSGLHILLKWNYNYLTSFAL